MTLDQLTADRVKVEVDWVIQSNDEWMFDDFFINYIHAPLPVGGGLANGVGDLTTYLTSKQRFIQIPGKADNLCCTRAIITAKARINNHPQLTPLSRGVTFKHIWLNTCTTKIRFKRVSCAAKKNGTSSKMF